LAQQSEEKRARAEDELLSTARLASSLEARLAAAARDNEDLRLEVQVRGAAASRSYLRPSLTCLVGLQECSALPACLLWLVVRLLCVPLGQAALAVSARDWQPPGFCCLGLPHRLSAGCGGASDRGSAVSGTLGAAAVGGSWSRQGGLAASGAGVALRADSGVWGKVSDLCCLESISSAAAACLTACVRA
jgi:hypothetical protein